MDGSRYSRRPAVKSNGPPVTQPGRLAVRSFAESSASRQAQVTGDQADGMRYGTVKVTLAARPVCFLKLTGITVAW